MLARFFRRRSNHAEPCRWELDKPLLQWSRHDTWTIRDAVAGTGAFGGTGSGKSSGSGAYIARAMLRDGFGGLVLTAKADERALWESYCRETGRSHDLVVFGPNETLRFNFLDYELNRTGAGAGLTEDLVNLLSTVLEVSERNPTSGGGRESEGYWRTARTQLCRNTIDLLSLARGRITVPDLYRVVISAPTSPEQLRSDEWKSKSLCFRCLVEADKQPKTKRQQADFEIVADYFMVEFLALSDRTRSVIVSTFTSAVDVLIRGVLRDLFCTETNLTPEAALNGQIILLDLAVKEFGVVGQFAQVLWKYCFQRAMERRNVAENGRPVFLWADEAHHFITSGDMLFQTTCRAARVATILLTQNISNVYAALGGNEKGRVEADSLFANLSTKIFHANSDPVTNEWAARLIGRSRQFFASGNTSRSSEDRGPLRGLDWLDDPTSTSAGFSESYEYEVQPAAFNRLRTGGPANRWNVDAILFQSGRVFGTGKTWLPVTFNQKRRR
jgi:TraM recognition site of TraD and TraG